MLSIEVTPGEVTARVQGSRRTPYKVTLEVAELDARQWGRALDAIAEQALFAAKLLAGEMPQTIEEAFAAAEVPLFPHSATDLVTDCTCPDYANPCKHIAAVYYLLGERFDQEPFLLFELRGRGRIEIIAELRARRATAALEDASAPPPTQAPPLAELLASYDEPDPELALVAPRIAAPELEAALLRRLGDPPEGVAAELRTAYEALTRKALELLFADGDAQSRP